MIDFEQIRERVEATHEEALRAISVLQRYVATEGNFPGSKNDKHKTNGHVTKPRAKRAGTISARVLAVIETEWRNYKVQQARGALPNATASSKPANPSVLNVLMRFQNVPSCGCTASVR